MTTGFVRFISQKIRSQTWYPTRLPFPMHSPMKNQQKISVPTATFKTVWFTVQFLKVCFWTFATLVDRSAIATGSSPGEGGASSTLAYLQKVFSLGRASSLAVLRRAGAFLIRAAILRGYKSENINTAKLNYNSPCFFFSSFSPSPSVKSLLSIFT